MITIIERIQNFFKNIENVKRIILKFVSNTKVTFQDILFLTKVFVRTFNGFSKENIKT